MLKLRANKSPSAIQMAADALVVDDEEGLAIHKPNASLLDHINYGSITRATKQAVGYF